VKEGEGGEGGEGREWRRVTKGVKEVLLGEIVKDP